MKNELINWAEWLKNEIGFDSFRLDNLKDMRWDFAKEFADHFRDNTLWWVNSGMVMTAFWKNL